MYKLWDYLCMRGHVFESLENSHDDAMAICPECQALGVKQIGGKNRLLYYEEGRARVDHHLGHDPVVITSERQHQKLMKEAGVTFAGTRRGMKGQWI
jgi:predicted nucleic acid-binding Zn ribbon protein